MSKIEEKRDIDRRLKEAENCWEFWDCSDDAKSQCPVFKTRDGKRCWIYTDNLKVFDWAKGSHEFDTCLQCPWYKKFNPVKK